MLLLFCLLITKSESCAIFQEYANKRNRLRIAREVKKTASDDQNLFYIILKKFYDDNHVEVNKNGKGLTVFNLFLREIPLLLLNLI